MKRGFRFIKPSTRAFFREGKKAGNVRLLDAVHGYIYGRWIYQYIGIGTGEHWLAKLFLPLAGIFHRLGKPFRKENGKSFADTYHGKVVSLEGARELVTVNQPVRILDLEQVIPYARARDIILLNPDHIVVLDCPCRSARPTPCSPLDVCLVIGEPFASFVHEHHPGRSRRISQQDALDILAAEHKRGHVHHAFFKEAMLNRFYAICNCCSCCCGAIQAMRNGVPMLASSGFVAQVDQSLCVHCGRCATHCQFDALFKDGEQVHFDESKCLGCGVCVDVCRKGARRMEAAPDRGVPLEIRRLTTFSNQESWQ
ncbi:MAG: 4Fe-4S binding protein [Thermodesulfobacteriota bacterium]